MSLQQWIHIRHYIHNIPWKTFVRESSNTQNESPERHTHQLAFQGNEAKAAYEEIIQQTSATTVRLKCLKSKSVENQSNSGTSLTFINAQAKRTTISDDGLAKVTINTLLKAVEQKDLKFLQKYMTSENVNISDDFGWTPLMSAAYCGHLEIVQFLLSLGANKRIRDRSGLTAAQLALKRNYLSIVALLKKKPELASNNNQSAANVSRTCSTSALPVRSVSMESSMERDTDVSNLTEEKTQFPQNVAFYCEICKASFQETTPQKHESSTLHIFNTKPKLKHAMYGISRHSKGYRMLLNTGWDEEVGLGPSGKGIKYPVKTCLKIDRKGLGQPVENEYKITHFKPNDTAAVNSAKVPKQKPLKKRDRERLLHRETRKERALRIALS
ncbi:hypothetical protein DMN91_001772 [Ooceraea biroi]|uniref:G patch domain and ankyrin repeats-containing protein 1-like protein n=1 Tax=Ooceraea biroi TaxID=2015173 RepID=A0A026W254_OOCBI|nr:G patch domain and ankyrin repeat-containing protein 1 homolog [Ooceraea biroi]XP_011345475.1 G patch domain and ankyrin repeat-containing protein 1 homolog [Ooceraea biroi]EZA50165.1 G patch domain and ankyrin repeats-containing protein 1-like protein [Ooceraea biroi]RLU25615.1 hypothetical protein DMN91_001772 [Ooceraea biroi]